MHHQYFFLFYNKTLQFERVFDNAYVLHIDASSTAY